MRSLPLLIPVMCADRGGNRSISCASVVDLRAGTRPVARGCLFLRGVAGEGLHHHQSRQQLRPEQNLQGRLHLQGAGRARHRFLLAANSGGRHGLVRLPAPERRQGAGIRQRKRELQLTRTKKPRVSGAFRRRGASARGKCRPEYDHSAAWASTLPNNAANRFSPVRVKLTTRLPGAGSRAAQFSSVKRFITAAPSVPAR